MMRRIQIGAKNGLLAVLLSLIASACTARTLAFGTATKFGLDIAQRPDRIPEVTLGYDRYEVISIPARDLDATEKETFKQDTYSTMAIFSFAYGRPLNDEPLIIRQFFATGWAARNAAQDKKFQNFFGRKTGEILRQAEQDLQKLQQEK